MNLKKPKKGNEYYVNVKKLKAHPLNAQLFGRNDSNYIELKQSIDKNGFLTNHPIHCCVTNKNFTIISGHRRWRAATELGIDQVPVTIISIGEEEEIERIMVEENLLRPQEGRQFTHLERYMLGLRLSAAYPERRGGDRRSSDFMAHRGNDKTCHKDTWLSEKTGLCAKYISELNVIAKKICEETEKAYPELLSGKPLFEQLQIILKDNLSAELSALQAGTTISTLYNKYRTSKPKPTPNPPASPQISCTQVDHLRLAENTESGINPPEYQDPKTAFFSAFRDFIMAEFAANENIKKAIQLLSDPPQGHIATLKSVQKVANLLLQTPRKQGVKTKNIDANQSLLIFENFENGGLK